MDRIHRMSPQLLVIDLASSVAFYTDILGFELEFRYENFYAGIRHGSHSIHLKCGRPALKEPGNVDILFGVEQIEACYEELIRLGVEFTQALREMPYGKEFYIADPDGHVLAFIER